jgi:hypothetical protein
MALTLANAKIINFDITFDAAPVRSVEGQVVWADVWIDYAVTGLVPTVTIRVPVPWNESDTRAERKDNALRCARELIGHACRTSAAGSDEAEGAASFGMQPLGATTPPALEGLAQELAMAKATTQPAGRALRTYAVAADRRALQRSVVIGLPNSKACESPVAFEQHRTAEGTRVRLEKC